MKFRSLIFWLHLTAGVVAGSVVLVMSATGVLLTYEKQMVAWAERSPEAAAPSPDATRAPLDSLLASARQAKPDVEPATITMRADPNEPVTVSFGRDGQLLLNAYSGAVIGEGATSLRAFFRSVTDWHRWLAASGDYRDTGRAVTGACNLAFLLLVITGAYLWLPQAWSRAQLRPIVWFRGGLAGKARDFNWHNTIGVWCFLPLFVVVLSATVISYPWASNLAYRVMGEAPPASAPRGAGAPGARENGERAGRREGRAAVNATTVAEVATDVTPYSTPPMTFAAAERQVTGWRAITLRLPTNEKAPLVYTIDTGWAGEPHKRGTLTVDRATGAVVKWETFSTATPGRRLRTILRFAHTGEVLGLVGQTVAGIASLGATVLVYTGIALSLRRFAAWRKRRGVAASEVAA